MVGHNEVGAAKDKSTVEGGQSTEEHLSLAERETGGHEVGGSFRILIFAQVPRSCHRKLASKYIHFSLTALITT